MDGPQPKTAAKATDDHLDSSSQLEDKFKEHT